jgi:hypothetical protein
MRESDSTTMLGFAILWAIAVLIGFGLGYLVWG